MLEYSLPAVINPQHRHLKGTYEICVQQTKSNRTHRQFATG